MIRLRWWPPWAALLLVACGAPSPNASSASAPSPQLTRAPSPPLATAPPATVVPATVVPATAVAIPTQPPAPTSLLLAPTEAAAPPAAAPVAVQRFQVVPDQSKATFRVREELARLRAPSDAVGTTGKVTGQIVIAEDGAFPPGQSRISVDLNDLRTDDQLRDGFIKRTTLETQRFRTADFVPATAEGLPVPLPPSGEHTFRLIGQLSLHGVQKDLTWEVTARRDGSRMTGTATTHFSFGEFGMQPPQAAVVLSVVDDIRVEIAIVAAQLS